MTIVEMEALRLSLATVDMEALRLNLPIVEMEVLRLSLPIVEMEVLHLSLGTAEMEVLKVSRLQWWHQPHQTGRPQCPQPSSWPGRSQQIAHEPSGT